MWHPALAHVLGRSPVTNNVTLGGAAQMSSNAAALLLDWTRHGVQANLQRPVAWQAVRQATAELVQNELRCFLQPAERVKLYSALDNRAAVPVNNPCQKPLATW